jgi:hypothetical protein
MTKRKWSQGGDSDAPPLRRLERRQTVRRARSHRSLRTPSAHEGRNSRAINP